MTFIWIESKVIYVNYIHSDHSHNTFPQGLKDPQPLKHVQKIKIRTNQIVGLFTNPFGHVTYPNVHVHFTWI